MRALVLTSTNLRHRYFSAAVAERFDLVGVLSQAKQNYYAAQQEQSAPIRAHFQRICEAEESWFAPRRELPATVQARSVVDINASECVAWAQALAPDVVCLFGTAILKDAWLDLFPGRIVNLHLGLSPFYRGSATLFWPFVNGELDCLGTTIHLASAKVDAGEILARIPADLHEREDYYASTSRLIRDSIDRFPGVVADYLDGKLRPYPQEPVQGRLYRKADFSEASLNVALSYVGAGLSAIEIERIKEAARCRCSR